MNGEQQLIVAVAAVLIRGDRLLCMRRGPLRDAGPGLWETLSGRVRPGEEPLAALRREIAEECGLEAEIDSRPVTAYAARRNDQPMVVIVYRGRAAPGEVRISHEHDAYDWLTVDEFAGRSSLDMLSRAARAALELPWPTGQQPPGKGSK